MRRHAVRRKGKYAMASAAAEAQKAAIRQMRESTLEGTPTLEEQRAGAELFGAMSTERAGVTYEPVTVDGIAGQWVLPQDPASDRVILYLHGGGYVICSVNSHRRMIGHLAAEAGCKALAIDYRLAPEHPHPAAVDDAVKAYRWLLKQGYAPERVTIAGDSAGGGLTMATLVALRDAGDPMPAGALPISPWVDLEALGESMTTNAHVDLMVAAEGLKAMSEAYLQGQDARHPTAAPLYADLRGLPPLYIQVGGDETLLDDSTRLAAKAAASGVAVRLDVFPEMQHVFQMAAGNVPEADDALARAGAWLRERSS